MWPGIPSSSRCTRKNSGARGLTGFTRSGRRNGTSGAPWNRTSTPRSSCRRLMFLCRRWRTNYWRYADRSIHLFPSRLSTCPRSPLPVSLTGAVFALLSRRQNSWWKYRRSYRTHRYAGLWSRTWTFQLLLVVVVVVAVSVFTQDRVQQHLVEQIIVQGLPSKSLTFQLRVVAKIFLLQRRLPVCRVRQIMGFFALFPVGKKCALGLALGVGTAPRVEPIHAGGSAGGFLHGCSRCLDAVP